MNSTAEVAIPHNSTDRWPHSRLRNVEPPFTWQPVKYFLFIVWFLPLIVTIMTSVFILRIKRATPFAVSVSLLHATTVLTLTAMACYFSLQESGALNEHMCKVWITLELFFSNNSLLHLAFFSLDAYLHLLNFVASQSGDSNGHQIQKCFKAMLTRFGSLDEPEVNSSGSTKNHKNSQVGMKASLVWLISPWVVSMIQSTVEFILDEAEVKSEDMTLEFGLCFIPEKNFVLLGFWFSYLFPLFMALGFARMWRRKLSEHFHASLHGVGGKNDPCCSTSLVSTCAKRLKLLNSSKRDGKRSYSYQRLDKSPIGLTLARATSAPRVQPHKFVFLSSKVESDPVNVLSFQSLEERSRIIMHSIDRRAAISTSTSLSNDRTRTNLCSRDNDDDHDDDDDDLEARSIADQHETLFYRSAVASRLSGYFHFLDSSATSNFHPIQVDSDDFSQPPPSHPGCLFHLKNGDPSGLFVFSGVEKLVGNCDSNSMEQESGTPFISGLELSDLQGRPLHRTTSTTNLLPVDDVSSAKEPPHSDHLQCSLNHQSVQSRPLISRRDELQVRGSAPNFSNFSPSTTNHSGGISIGLPRQVPSITLPPPAHSLSSSSSPIVKPQLSSTRKSSVDHFSAPTHRMVMKLLFVYCLAWFPLQACNVVYAVCFWRECRSHVTYAGVMTFKWMAYSSAFICNLIIVLSLPQ